MFLEKKARSHALHMVYIALIGSTAWYSTAFAQETLPAAGVIRESDFEPGDARAELPSVGTGRLDQRFDFNGVNLEFSPGTIAKLPIEAGTSRNTILNGNITATRNVEIGEDLEASSEGVRFNNRQSTIVFQLGTTDRRRTVTRSIDEEGELLGFRLDFSATGRCFLPGSPVDDYCTYTPGLSTTPGAVDPDTLVPTAFLATSNFGQVIPEASHESLFPQGFQRGEDVLGGPLLGISVDVLNAGFATDNRSDVSGHRFEETATRLVPMVGRVEQTLSTSSEAAAATRTVRAFVLPEEREIDGAYVAMQLGAMLLPSANSTVPYAESTPDTSVSNNLFFAMNNARLPADSYTIFQTGRADVANSSTPARSAAETPVAQYNGIWMGMSPVRHVSTSERVQFVPTGERKSVNDDPAFAEGGVGTPFDDLAEAGITLVDQFDESITSVNLQNVDDLYVQLGLDLTRQDAVRRTTVTETSDTRLVPHLSFNGNKTGGETVLRYYGGVIFADDPNAYIGADYTLATETGDNAYARLDLYSEDNPDYRSELEIRGSRTYAINADRKVTVGAGGLLALDKDTLFTMSGFSDTGEADIFGRWREGPMEFTVSEQFSRDGADDWNQRTTIGVTYSNSDRFSISTQLTPWSDEGSYVEAAVGVNYRLDGIAGDTAIKGQIARINHDLGVASTGERVMHSENVLTAGLSMRF